ncbi:MAG: IS256 family transposase [Proteobacteria bacterium]|nr:IS256 family transposase [Pseudomonadota bacterium]
MTNEHPKFDFNEALEQLKAGKPLSGKSGILTPLIKELTEAALEGELESHLSQEISKNRKNGKSKKQIKSTSGCFELEVPRDRSGTFEPQIVKKRQTTISDEIESKVLALYGYGMSYRDISSNIEDIYGIKVSSGTLNTITDKIIPKVKEWQSRPLESVYPVVWMDAIHYKIREDGKVISKAVYTILGINSDGLKEVLGLYISENEGARFWLQVLTDLSNRGVQDILIACVDGLKGFPEAIESIFPETEVQLCVVHQIRNSMKYVTWKDYKSFMSDLKKVYKASSREIAEVELDTLEDKWSLRYPIVIKSWRNNWENLSHYFKYPEEIRRIIYTTNAIEAVHRQFRKLTKTKGAFPNQNSLLKLLYMGIQNASKKWTMPLRHWKLSLSQLSIFFEGRMEKGLKL